MLNEAHFTYSRESRPRTAVDVEPAADTGIGFAPSFRFGNPFFLQPNVDELIWRDAVRRTTSRSCTGAHTIKVGGEWMHTLNDQVFRGFFTGRYLFDSVAGLPALRLAGGARRVRAVARSAARTASYVTAPGGLPGGHRRRRRAAALLSAGRGARPARPPTPRARRRSRNDEFSLFVQDQWQVRPNLTVNYGLRWDAQLMPETVDPQHDGVRARS